MTDTRLPIDVLAPDDIAALFERLCSAPRLPFPPSRTTIDAPAERGVYVIFAPTGHALHVGRTPRGAAGLSQRLKDHLAGRSSFVREHLGGDGARLRQGHTFSYVVVDDPRARALLEHYATGHLCPVYLGLGDA